MSTDSVLLSRQLTPDGVLTLTFNRPDQLNAMNRALMTAIIDALLTAGLDPAVRVIVLTGAGRAFMAGADLKEYAAQTRAEFDSFQALGRRLYAAIEQNPKPVLAAINGHCFGGGFEIALACDFLFAAAGAKCGLPEINLALIPGGGGTPRLAQRAGLGRALDVAMTGRVVLAEELLQWGVINRVFPAAEFAAQVERFAHELAAREPEPLQVLKRLARTVCPSLPAAVETFEGEALGRFFTSPAGQRKIAEFMARSDARKKPPGLS
jgi:enoyl-CoA hydratase/carnithine racemase